MAFPRPLSRNLRYLQRQSKKEIEIANFSLGEVVLKSCKNNNPLTPRRGRLQPLYS